MRSLSRTKIWIGNDDSLREEIFYMLNHLGCNFKGWIDCNCIDGEKLVGYFIDYRLVVTYISIEGHIKNASYFNDHINEEILISEIRDCYYSIEPLIRIAREIDKEIS